MGHPVVNRIDKQDNATLTFLISGRMRPAARSRSRTSSTSTMTTRSTSRMRGRARSTGWTRPRPPTPRTACGTSPTWPRRPRRGCSRSRANTAAVATGTLFNFVVSFYNWHLFASGLLLANMSCRQNQREEGRGVVFNFIGTFCGICHLYQLYSLLICLKGQRPSRLQP